jgi:hypothetical protein
MARKPKGSKYVLTAVFLALSSGSVLASFVLALKGKLSGDWVQIVNTFLLAIAAPTVGYQAARAFTDGKAIDKGMPEKAE